MYHEQSWFTDTRFMEQRHYSNTKAALIAMDGISHTGTPLMNPRITSGGAKMIKYLPSAHDWTSEELALDPRRTSCPIHCNSWWLDTRHRSLSVCNKSLLSARSWSGVGPWSGTSCWPRNLQVRCRAFGNQSSGFTAKYPTTVEDSPPLAISGRSMVYSFSVHNSSCTTVPLRSCLVLIIWSSVK